MRHTHLHTCASLFSATFFIASISISSVAQTVQPTVLMIEPARWTQEDVTEQQKYTTATKESIAAQHEAIKNCQMLDALQRSACVALARTTYNEEMTAIRLRFSR